MSQNKSRLRYHLVTAAILLICTATARAEPDIDVSTHYYDIHGDRASELRVQMNRKGPRGFDAYASWYVRWRYDHFQASGQCQASNVSTSVDVEITLPRWVDEDDADGRAQSHCPDCGTGSAW